MNGNKEAVSALAPLLRSSADCCPLLLLGAGASFRSGVPTAADAALYARKKLNGHALTPVQCSRLARALVEFEIADRGIVDAAIVPEKARTKVLRELDKLDNATGSPSVTVESAEHRGLKQLVARSGIRTAEAVIQYRHDLRNKK